MELHNPNAEIFVPDGKSCDEALNRITHLGVGAHQDDLEFMAFHGIVECYSNNQNWFGGVTCTNGGGCARTGQFAGYTDEQMATVRRQEQNRAATTGRYGTMIQLDYPSSVAKNPIGTTLCNDLREILVATRPRVVYTHNPADKHDTHIGVLIAGLQAMRALPREQRPVRVIGCEMWRDLDWLPDREKVVMDVSGHDELGAALASVFTSQIAGGKRYDLAINGRRRANATFFESHATDRATALCFGMDLTPLIQDETRDVSEYVGELIGKFKLDVQEKLTSRRGR